MKIPLRFLLLTSVNWAQAQITSPFIRGKFGVDADVQNNWFNNGVLAGNDDWYFRNGLGSSGVFVIDTTGAGAIVWMPCLCATTTTLLQPCLHQVPIKMA